MIEAARTVKRHWGGILRWFDSKIANGLIEGINSLVQAAKAKARGYLSLKPQPQGHRLLARWQARPQAARLKTLLPTRNSEEPYSLVIPAELSQATLTSRRKDIPMVPTRWQPDRTPRLPPWPVPLAMGLPDGAAGPE
jgi:hypothetical protein